MAIKVKIRVGEVEVEYEGEDGFLEKKLPEIISQLSRIAWQAPTQTPKISEAPVTDDSITLPAFLKAKQVGGNQVQRFLATAEWLHLRGRKMLKTADVSKALRDNHQSRLGNPADCLNKNVAKGHCEKTGSEFFVTDEGRALLG
jgi:hypothetical protein